MLKKTLAKYRGEEAKPIMFHSPPDLLLDEEYCLSLKEELFEIGNEWEHVIINQNSAEHIPNHEGIYMFVWKSKLKLITEHGEQSFRNVLYVGKAIEQTIRQRFTQEYKEILHSNYATHWQGSTLSTRKERLTQILNLEDIEMWVLVSQDKNEITRLEKKLIHAFLPPGNYENASKNKIKARSLPPEAAF